MKKILVLIILITALLNAAPIIEADSANFYIGIIEREHLKDVEHTFIIKNSGDEPLKISRIKPGWGCTLVDYDSVIQPGGSGKVKAVIKKHKLGDGHFTKSMRIYSNAKNDAAFKVAISGVVLTPIATPKKFLRVESLENSTATVTFPLLSKKEDLAVSKVIFRESRSSSQNGGGTPLITNAKTVLTKLDKKDEYGYREYSLKVSLSIAPVKILSGDFIISTNHPKQKDVLIRGMILPPPTDK